MSAKINYTKIGLFVVASVFVAMGAVVALGSGSLFRQRLVFETYLNESVQGLEVGAPVKYRGVQVGNVMQIAFVEDKYPTTKRYVLILIDFYPATENSRRGNFDERVRRLIQEGLRVRLASQGLAGAMYLEADYLDPRKNPPLEIEWIPANYYVPSVASTASRLTESAQEVVRQLADARLAEIGERANTLLADIIDIVEEDLAPAVKNLNLASAELPDAVREVRGHLNRILAKDLEPLITVLTDSARSDLAPALADLRAASRGLPGTIDGMGRVLRRVDGLLYEHEYDLDEIVENLRLITEQVQGWTEQAVKYPGRVLFGGPPPRAQ